MKIVADKNIPFLKGVAEFYGDVSYLAGAEFTREAIKDADALIVRTVTHFDEQMLADTSVKLICSATIGYDHIDTEYCDSHNIIWKNAPGCNSGSVQQYVVASLLVMAEKQGFDLKDKTIGIVGVGNVGKKVAKACRLLGMKVLLNDPPRAISEGKSDFVDIETIKRDADIITFHTPLARDGQYPTCHLADDAFFNELTRKPIIINSARGGIIDTKAIKKAYSSGLISGAVIDCWENEPNIDTEYMNMVDIATPHIAGYSADGKANATRMSLESIADFSNQSKEPLSNIVAPDVNDRIIDYSRLKGDNKLAQTILRTYTPNADFESLLAAPDKFSKLRGNYPLRREYGNYIVNNIDDARDLDILKKLGFNIE